MAHPAPARRGGRRCGDQGFGVGAFLFDLGDPGGDHGGVGAGFEGGAVPLEFGVALDNGQVCGLACRVGAGRPGGGLGEHLDGVVALSWVEEVGQPGVDGFDEDILAEVDVAGVLDLVGQGVFLRVAASVVGDAVGVLALHAALADTAVHDAAEHVWVAGAVLAVGGAFDGAAAGEQFLGECECLVVDDRDVGGPVGSDPLGLSVPAHDPGVAEGDVVDVEEDLVGSLPVPDLLAGVAGVGEDGPHGALGPGDAGAVPVAGRVLGRWAGDVVGGEAFGDGEQAVAVEELLEDALHDRCGVLVRDESVQVTAVGGFGRVGVWSERFQGVAVWWAAAEEPSFQPGLAGHRGPHAQFDPVPFAFTHTAEHRHNQFVGFVVRVDRTADLRDPELHAVVDEQGQGETELVAVERPVRFADDDGVEATGRVAERGEEAVRVAAALPRHRAALTDVEEPAFRS